jgi:benzoyl-CoA reductase subunit B
MEERKASNRLTTTREIGQMVSLHYDDLNRAHQEGRLVAWCFGSVPSLILRAANIAYLWGNQYGASASARGLEKELHDAADKAGYSRSLCSYCRSNIGVAMLIRGTATAPNPDPYYSIPAPDFLVSLNPHCHINMYWMDVLRRQFNCPVFYFQLPHEWERNETEMQESIGLTVREHQRFISFLEDITHRKFDWDSLKNLMIVAKKAGVARLEAMELCKNIPSPATYFDWLNSLAPVNLLAGASGTAEVMEKMKKEITERALKKEGAILNERYRLYYDGIGPYPVLGQASRKFAELGANVVCGRYVNLGFYSDPEKFDPNQPLETLSEGLCRDFQLNWNFDHMAERVIELCKEYRVDGLVFQITKTCRSTSNREIELMDAVSTTLDLPVAFMEGDQTDRSFYHMDHMFKEVETLLMAIDAKRGAKKG